MRMLRSMGFRPVVWAPPTRACFADMKIGRDCSSPLHSRLAGALLHSAPLTDSPLLFRSCPVDRMTPLACRRLRRQRLLRPAPHIPLRGMFVAVDRPHAERSVTRSPRPRADALARCERGPLRPESALRFHRKLCVRSKAIRVLNISRNPHNKYC